MSKSGSQAVLDVAPEVVGIIIEWYTRTELLPKQWSHRLFDDKNVRYGIRMLQMLMRANRTFRDAIMAHLVRFRRVYISSYSTVEEEVEKLLNYAHGSSFTFVYLYIAVGSDPHMVAMMNTLEELWLQRVKNDKRVQIVGLNIDCSRYWNDARCNQLGKVLPSMTETLHFVCFSGGLPDFTAIRSAQLTFPFVTELLLCDFRVGEHVCAQYLTELAAVFPNVEHLGLGAVFPHGLDQWASLKSVLLNPPDKPDQTRRFCEILRAPMQMQRFTAGASAQANAPNQRVLRLVIAQGEEKKYALHMAGMLRRFVPDHDLPMDPVMHTDVNMSETGCFDLTLYHQLLTIHHLGWFKPPHPVVEERMDAVRRYVKARRNDRFSQEPSLCELSDDDNCGGCGTCIHDVQPVEMYEVSDGEAVDIGVVPDDD